MKVCRGVYLSMNFFHLSNTLGSAYMGSISAGQICKYFKLGTICVDLGFFLELRCSQSSLLENQAQTEPQFYAWFALHFNLTSSKN